jgi:broad specificity phosphatase PhoE
MADRTQPDVWLVRHGETEWSRLGRHTGRTDVPLTDAGREQAVAVGRALAGRVFALVLSSPMSRALDTARLAGYAAQVRTSDDLREWDYGAYEGLTTPEIRREDPGWTIWRDGPVAGESIHEVAARADRVVELCRQSDGDALIFAHGHMLRVMASRWLGEPPSDGRLLALSTGTISVLGWERETAVIERWNQPC